ncbi:DNA topoisomerase [Acidaminobacter sp. JC074]|uniref:toprim domain-containing protein n=1 Tax=Acidaminobacter sp. JC074 TaxID=2530199 RepID=UPI001F0EC338|nr:toprim domain-containing protein [Acidaminobacter sp. JC074]MCH4891283.1 DNA topoisomerase [Acidaminobacter sp. JC074]
MVRKKKDAYGNNSISALKGADRVRKRPAVIFGSDGLEGCQHSFFEILSNSIDEAREGHGNVIEVTRHDDWSITVRDYGRGIPLDYNEKERKYNWKLVYCELYAGGKYNNNDGENYEYSLGLNGLGACATQYASEYMEVVVYKDNIKYSIDFKKGKAAGKLEKEPFEHASGTIQKWKPDLDVFTDIQIPLSFYQDVMKKQSIVNPGVIFKLYDEFEDETYEYCYENGIVDYIKEVNEDKNFTEVMYYTEEGRGRDREDKPDYKVKAELAFSFNNEVNLTEYYHNSSYLEHGGAPDKAVKNAFIYEIDKFIKKVGKYTKGEKKISFQDVQDSLVIVINSFSTMTSYENQTKKAINNKFIQEFITDLIKSKLEIYFIENKIEAEKIIDQVLVNKRSREKAEKTRLNLKKKLGGKVDMNNRVAKFVDCRTKDKSRRELYIVEGDSALGSCKLARDADFQALMPVRGKILNCLKADYDKIFKSEIIIDLLKVLGCGVEIKSKHNKDLTTFDLDNLNWDKVIICTDADYDGFQIRTLIMTMLYRLVPTLFDENKVFIAETPLYEITNKGKTYFAYTDKEKNDICEPLEGSIHVQRSKGLGENDPEMMWQTTMSPETRKLVGFDREETQKTVTMFETLLGDDIQGRKIFIEENGAKYLDMLDIN